MLFCHMLELYSRRFIDETFLTPPSTSGHYGLLRTLTFTDLISCKFEFSLENIVKGEFFWCVFFWGVLSPFPFGILSPRFLNRGYNAPSGKWRLVYHALYVFYNLLPTKRDPVCMWLFQWVQRKNWLEDMHINSWRVLLSGNRGALQGSFLHSVERWNVQPLWQVDKVI